MDIIHPGLDPDGADTRESEHHGALLVTDVPSIHHPIVVLLNAVPVDRIVEKKCEIRKQIKLVVLTIGVGEELATARGIVVVIQTACRAERLAALRPPEEGFPPMHSIAISER